MDLSNVTELLGSFYLEAPLKQFLDALGPSEKPRLPRDSTTTFLHRYDLGIEITFTGQSRCAGAFRVIRLSDANCRRHRTDPLLRSATFHRQRDQDGLGWDGELPAGLDFEDSPEDLFRKLNAAPVQQADSALTGHGVWQLGDYTLHVLYSNVDNRLIRVKVSVPVTG